MTALERSPSAPVVDLVTGGLLSRLFRVEGPLLAGRYRRALEEVTGRTTELESFHLDAAGYSPEVAAELEDPFYLGEGAGHPAFVLLSVDQLDAPLLQPNAGLGAVAYLRWAASVRHALARLTLGEAVVGELCHGLVRLSDPAQAARVPWLELRVHTPSGRLGAARRLRRMRDELVLDELAWQDEAFLAEMRRTAEAALGWVQVPAELGEGYRLPVGPSVLPEFGGCYLWPGGEEGMSPATVLVGGGRSEAGPPDGSVEVLPLEPGPAWDFLVERGLVEPRPDAVALAGPWLDDLEGAVARHHLRARGRTEARVQAAPLRALREEEEIPDDFRELEELRLRSRRGEGKVDLEAFGQPTRLRLAPWLVRRPEWRWWVAHLCAALDPVAFRSLSPRGGVPAPGLLAAEEAEADGRFLEVVIPLRRSKTR